MAPVPWLPERLDRWLTVERPVSYWTFWAALLRLAALLALLFALSLLAGEQFVLRAFAPLPFVFVAATLGYAVRAFDGVGVLVSGMIASSYAFLLRLTGVGELLLTQPTPLLSVLSILTFIALLAGFGSSALHGEPTEEEFATARRHWEE
jgi:hypothetical protein